MRSVQELVVMSTGNPYAFSHTSAFSRLCEESPSLDLMFQLAKYVMSFGLHHVQEAPLATPVGVLFRCSFLLKSVQPQSDLISV